MFPTAKQGTWKERPGSPLSFLCNVSLQGLEAKHNGYLAVHLLNISQHCQAQWEPEQFQAAFSLLYFAPGKWTKAESSNSISPP